MKQLLNKEDLIGKTILRTHVEEKRIFLFLESDYFAIFENASFNDSDLEFLNCTYNTEIGGGSDIHELRRAGFISTDEYNKYVKKIKDRRKREQRKHEKNEFERLRKKFKK